MKADLPSKRDVKAKRLNNRQWAEELERRGDLLESAVGKGDTSIRDYEGRQADAVTNYTEASKYRLKAKQISNAIRDYKKIVGIYETLSEYSPVGERTLIYEKLRDETQEKLDRLRKVRSGKWKGLAGKITAGVFTILGLFFLSPNITGNVIGNMPANTFNLTGAILFLVGIVWLFFTFRRNK